MSNFKKLTTKEKAEYIAVIALYPLFMLFSTLGKTCKLFSKKKQQITASVLSFCMILSMVPLLSLTAFAAGGNGDVTGDNNVNTADMVAVREHLLGTSPIAEERLNNADVTGDGIVNCDDYTHFSAYFSGKIQLNGSFEISHHITIDDKITVYANVPFSQSITSDTELSNFKCYTNSDSNLFSVNSTTGMLTCNATQSNMGEYKLFLEGMYNDVAYAKVVTVTVTRKVTSWSELQTAINAGGNIKLMQDIVATSNDAFLRVQSNNPVTIDLNGHTINRNLSEQIEYGCVFYIYGGNLTIEDNSATKTGKITGGKSIGDNGGGVSLFAGTFTLNSGNITGNKAESGAGVFIMNTSKDCTFIMNGGDISGNTGDSSNYTTSSGGGVYVSDEYFDNMGKCYFTMNSGIITKNSAYNGGGVYVGSAGIFTMNDGNISSNGCLAYGGGVNNYGGKTIMNGGSIENNSTVYVGGGVYAGYGTFTMNDGIIKGNSSKKCGGGVGTYVGTFEMKGGSITDNKANTGKEGGTGGGVYFRNIFKVSGGAIIKNNKLFSGKTNNVVLTSDSKVITVTGALTGEIGITSEKAPTKSTPVVLAEASTDPAYTLAAGDIAVFSTDVTGYELSLDNANNTVQLNKIIGTLKAEDFTFTAATDLTYSGTTKTATVKTNASCGAITVNYYDANGNKLESAPTAVGTYTVKIDVSENDNYKAATDLTDASWTFTISAKELAKSDLTVTGIGDEIYTGSAIQPVPTVKYGTKALVKDTDYTLVYGANTAIGNGSVIVNFIGNYSGSADYDFNINYGKATTEMYDLPATDYNGWYNSVKTIRAKSGYQIGVFTDYFYSDIDIPDEGENCSQEFYLKATDGKIYKETISYNMDYQKPDVDITVKENSIKKFFNSISFGVLCKNTADVKIIANDECSGVAKTEYQVVDNEADYDENGVWTNGNSFSLSANKICYIYARAIDKAGNQTIESSKKLAIATDSEAYDKSVTFVKTSTDNVCAKVKLNGNTIHNVMIDEIYSGDDVYTISDENPDTIILKASYLNTLPNGTHTVKVYYNPLGDSNLCTSSESEQINEQIATTSFELIVTNRVLKKDDFTYTAPSDLTYNGSQKTATVKYKSINDGSEIAVEYWQNNIKLPSAPKDAGTYTVKVSTIETDNYAAAKSLTIDSFTIEKAEQSKPQSVSAINTTTLQNNDGKLTGVTDLMQYQKSGDSEWTAVVNKTVNGLSNGIYLVRYCEKENYKASDSAQVTIQKFIGTKESTPTVTYDATTKGLSGLVDGQKVRTNGGDWETYHYGHVLGFTVACKIEIYKPGDGIHTLDSDIQTITVTKATAPVLGKTDETIKNKADGTITGTTTALEQRINGDWTSDLKTVNLPVGQYEFRVKATGTVLESDIVTVTISEGKMLSVTTPTAKEYTINSTNSKLIAYNGNFSFSISVKDGYNSDNMVVKANSTTINPANGTYTVNDITTDTTITVSGIADTTSPTAEIEISNNKFNQLLNNITFGLFFKETQTVTVTAEDKDGSGVDKIYYYLANDITTDFTDVSWTEFEGSFNISPNNKYVVYVKVTDKSGNEIIINSDGIVLDNIVPQISAENGKTYCEKIEVTVTDDNLDTVMLDGDSVTLTDNKFTVFPKSGEQTIVATDKSGNSTTVNITVNDGHTWGDGVVTTEPTAAKEGVMTYTCKVCRATKTESIPKLAPTMVDGENGHFVQGSSDGLTFKSDAALSDFVSVSVDGNVIDADNYALAEGGTIVTLKSEYLETLSVGKHMLDINSTSGTASTDFTIEGKISENTSPKTGDNSNMVMWICMLLLSVGVLGTLRFAGKKRKNNSAK